MSQTRRVPIATLIFIAINMLAAFGVLFDPDIVARFGFTRSHPLGITLISGLFLHQNLFHLAANMVFLAAVGPAVEFAAGTWRFTVVYLVGGLVGVLAHAILSTSNDPLIGASGCIAACAAYYTIRYISLRVPIAPSVAVPVVVVTVTWLILQAIGAFVHVGLASTGTAYWAHLGGFAAGLILSLTFRAPKLASLHLGHEVLERMNQRSPVATLSAADQMLKNHPNDPQALSQKAEAYRAMGDQAEEVNTLSLLFEYAPLDELEPVVERLAELDALVKLPSLKRAQMADRLKSVSVEGARLLLTSMVNGDATDPQRPDALLALATLDRENAPEEAQANLDVLVENYPLHPATEVARSRGWIK